MMEQNDLNELRELVSFLKDNGIAEFDLHRGEQHVHIKFAQAAPAPVAFDPSHFAQFAAAAAPVAAPAAVSAPVAAAPAASAEVLHEVKSPIVGTFYESSAPGSAPFVKVGDTISVGQVVCIVEAMKLMNEIESDVAGEVVKILSVNGKPVEYGQPLFAVRPR
ncbi:MAG: acetyl-CoA carboxylase biotin carboxyl carrier protein [Terriglobus sp.]